MVDVIGQYHRYQEEIDSAVFEVVRSGKYINGPYVQRFERAMEDYLSVKHAIACASGTDAIWLSLLAGGVGPSDEVLTTPFSFFATASVVALPLKGSSTISFSFEQMRMMRPKSCSGIWQP